MLMDRNLFSPDTRRSLILAGGGIRLAYQAGVLIALEEQKETFNHVDGTSGGIFNTGMLASGLSPHEMAERWRRLDIKNFTSPRPLKNYFKPLNMMGYADADGIRNVIFPELGIDLKKINANQRMDATFNVCNFSDKTVENIGHKQVEEDHLIAGVSLPIVMPALKIHGKWYSDSVWIKDANLIEAVKRGADELWLVWAIGNAETYLPGALNQYVHMIEMSADGGLLEEYDRIAMINEDIKDGRSKYGQGKPIRLFVIKPEYPLPLDTDLYLGKVDTRSLINMGYAQAKNALKSMPKNGVPFDAEATKMTEPGTRLNIRTEFHGFLASKKERLSAGFFAYFVFASKPGREVLHAFASIRIDQFKDEIPCYDCRVKASKIQGKTVIECTCIFNVREVPYLLKAVWNLNSAMDFMLGLEFKSVQISISKMNETETLYQGKLYQGIKKRFRAWFANNIRKWDGTSGGIGLKYRMFSKLLDYEV